jgi:myo-inositol-1-phosphate synthase
MSKKVRLAIVGVGNCASSLVQGIFYYRNKKKEEYEGLMFPDIGGYGPGDIEIVACLGYRRKKGWKDVSEAIFAPPNCTTVFYPDVPKLGVKVRMGKVLDGFAEHMSSYPRDCHLCSG